MSTNARCTQRELSIRLSDALGELAYQYGGFLQRWPVSIRDQVVEIFLEPFRMVVQTLSCFRGPRRSFALRIAGYTNEHWRARHTSEPNDLPAAQ